MQFYDSKFINEVASGFLCLYSTGASCEHSLGAFHRRRDEDVGPRPLSARLGARAVEALPGYGTLSRPPSLSFLPFTAHLRPLASLKPRRSFVRPVTGDDPRGKGNCGVVLTGQPTSGWLKATAMVRVGQAP